MLTPREKLLQKEINKVSKQIDSLKDLFKNDSTDEVALQMSLMKWHVERRETDNLSLIERASIFSGFSILEIGLIVNEALQKSSAAHHVKWALYSSLILTLFALLFFVRALFVSADGPQHENKDFVGKTQDELLAMMYGEFQGKVSEEHLQLNENIRRSGNLQFGIYLLLFSVIPTVYSLENLLGLFN